MSTIGKIFTVLNLILAAGFVVFTGLYLRESSDYRAQFTKASQELASQKNDFEARLRAKDEQLSNTKLQLSRSEASKDEKTRELDTAQKTLASLEKRLGAFEADHKTGVNNLASMNTTISTVSSDADKMRKLAMDSKASADDAVASKMKAEAALASANHDIAALRREIADQKGQLATLGQHNREQKVLLDLVKVKVPGLFTNLVPAVDGSVETVGEAGKLVTIALSAGQENLKAGHSFAIYSATDGYLGEATVTDIHESRNYAFAKMTVRREGARAPRSGDKAKTNLSIKAN